MIRSRAGRNRSFCRSSRGFDIASPEQSPLDQGITTRLKSESQIARNPSPIPPFLQNRLLAQARLSLCPSDIQILHGQLDKAARQGLHPRALLFATRSPVPHHHSTARPQVERQLGFTRMTLGGPARSRADPIPQTTAM